MGVPASEVSYTIATTRTETTKVHKNMWWHWGKKNYILSHTCHMLSQSQEPVFYCNNEFHEEHK